MQPAAQAKTGTRSAGHGGQFGLWSDTLTAKPSFHHAAYFGELTFSDVVVGR